MVEDSKSPAIATPETSIDGEYTAYRAIQPLASISLVFGIFSILCLLDLSFWPLVVIALASSGVAIRQIRKYPDLLTGQTPAKIGASLAIGFLLAASSINVTQYMINRTRASQFGTGFAKVLADEPLETLIWWELPAQARRSSTPEEAYENMVKQAPNPELLRPKVDPLKSLKARLASTPNQVVTFQGVKEIRVEELNVLASLLYDVTGPTSEAYPEPKQELLVFLKGNNASGTFEWSVESLRLLDGNESRALASSQPVPPPVPTKSKMPSAKSEANPE